MQRYELKSSDISASVISFGAALQSLLVKDKKGEWTDVVVGYDDPEEYTKTKSFNGAIIGRYTNRIKDGKFEIDGQKYQVPLSENGRTALHGGNKGWDQRHWDLVSQTDSSLTLGLLDPSGSEGFPGAVQASITYTLTSSPARLTVRIVALSLDTKTPIMPTTHTFFTLSGFSETTVKDDTLHLPHATRAVEVNDILIPTGGFIDVSQNGPNRFLDFTSPKKITANAQGEEFQSGIGLDHAFVFDTATTKGFTEDKPVQLEWSSEATGIRMTLRTNQDGIQIYSGAHHNGTTPVKKSQKGKGPEDTVQKFGCLAIEPQDWIDGINNPQWDRSGKQIFGPEDGPCVNWTDYTFDTV